MMDDRELLELAAKAAGLRRSTDMTEPSPGLWIGEDGELFEVLPEGNWCYWNPLVSDGDALRLAVKLRLSVHLDCVGAICASSVREGVSKAEESADNYAATRRAIVRAAAEIGKSMP